MRRVNECRSQRAVGARRQCRARAMGPGAVTPVAATYAIKRCAPNASASAVSVNRARIVAVARAKDGAKDGEGDDDEVGGLVCWRRGRAGAKRLARSDDVVRKLLECFGDYHVSQFRI